MTLLWQIAVVKRISRTTAPDSMIAAEGQLLDHFWHETSQKH
jgi:hypothetical protein